MLNYKSNLQSNNSALSANNADLQNLIDQVDNLPDASDGVELPTLTNEGSASDLLSGKQLIDQEGNVVTGTIVTRTSSNLYESGATVTVPAGYYASQATKSVSTAPQATPSVSIDSAGKITATSIQMPGYVSAGRKTGTKQLTTQSAKTITPSTSEQTAVASGIYTTGAVKVSAVPTQTKTATPTTSSQTITPDSGKFLSSVTVDAIPDKYVELPELSNAASAGDILSGKEAIDDEGNKITGNFSIDSELNTQDSLISQIQDIVSSLPEAGSSGATIEAWTGTLTTSMWTILGTNHTIHYTDETLNHRTITVSSGGDTKIITIAANTIICVEDANNLTGSHIMLNDISSFACLPTTNNFTIDIE